MKREDFIKWAESRGWETDMFGHLKKTEGTQEYPSPRHVAGVYRFKTYRYKLSRIAVRHEVKSASGWVRLRSGYFSKLSITTDGKLAGLTR